MRYPPRRPRTSKEKTMGRPINKDKIGYGSGRIAVSRHFFTGGSEATTAAHIVRQAGNNKFVVRLDSNNDGGGAFSPRTHASDEVLTLVNKADGALVAGEFKIDAVGSDSTTYQVTKLRNKTVQLEGSDNALYGIGVDASDKEISTQPNMNLSVNLPRQS
jgi:hypothetical protein